MARQNDHVRAEELISAYLDKHITAEEKSFFERHVASCPDCRAQLESTRSMVAALRAMPLVKAPRSFVLPRELARQPRRSFLPLYPALRLATVIAALAFVILFASDVLVNQSGGSSVAPSIPAAAPPLAVPQAPATLREAAPPQAATAVVNDAAAPTQAPTTTSGPAVAGAAAKTDLSNTAAMTGAAAMSAPVSVPAATPEVALQAQVIPETTPQPEAATSISKELAESVSKRSNAASAPAPTPGIEPMRIIEIVLLVLAAGFGIAALAARRKQA